MQVFNAIMGYFTWFAYGYSVSIWIIVALSVFYTILFFAIEIAREREASVKDASLKK